MHSGLSFFCGSTSWGKNEGLTDALLKRLGDCVRRRVDESGDEGIWRGGLIVDTPAEFAKKDKAAVVQRCVREFESERDNCAVQSRVYADESAFSQCHSSCWK